MSVQAPVMHVEKTAGAWTFLAYVFLPVMFGIGALGVWLSSRGGDSRLLLLPLLVLAVCFSFAVERAIPYLADWNESHEDAGRDAVHALINETLLVGSAAAVPLLTSVFGSHRPWPSHIPFVMQFLIAAASLDAGITLLHVASHRVKWLWRFHAVHHSVRRMYGFNGLMKHPVHQVLETGAGSLPLLALGVPTNVAAAAAFCVALMLLLQHSNAEYRTGGLHRVLALSKGHRFHHLRWAGVGDVNFGLFTLAWDRLLGTYSFDAKKRFTTADIGIDKWPSYPSDYLGQLVVPFMGRRGEALVAATHEAAPLGMENIAAGAGLSGLRP
jgi:sterol desaturase/sphingolipid hydroxylase (fatty acid hydroxylase superfamily)